MTPLTGKKRVYYEEHDKRWWKNQSRANDYLLDEDGEILLDEDGEPLLAEDLD